MTSRRKIITLTQAAAKLQCAVLIRTGGVPGIMFVKGREKNNVKDWVSRVRDLRYKNYQLLAKPEAVDVDESTLKNLRWGSVHETVSVKEFAAKIEEENGPEALKWWQAKMGFVSD